MRRIARKALKEVRTRLEEEQAGKLRKAQMLARCRCAETGFSAPLAGDEADLAIISIAEQLEHLELRRISSSVRSIGAALLTMEVGRYGVCLRCDKPIPFRRLQAIPSAILCRECQEAAESVWVGCRA
jgi:DnaK suppressor protein